MAYQAYKSLKVQCTAASAVGIIVKCEKCCEVPFILQGAASQTADLFQIQDATGMVIGGIRNDGTPFGTFKDIGVVGIEVKPMIIDGSASATANLQQWQNSDSILSTPTQR